MERTEFPGQSAEEAGKCSISRSIRKSWTLTEAIALVLEGKERRQVMINSYGYRMTWLFRLQEVLAITMQDLGDKSSGEWDG